MINRDEIGNKICVEGSYFKLNNERLINFSIISTIIEFNI